MELVVNEWLPEYIRPDAKDEEKRQVELFLNTFLRRPDCLFVKDRSPFHNKIMRYQKEFDYDLKARETFKMFIKLILRNLEKCRLVMEDELNELPKETWEKLNEGGKNVDSDIYLFEAANLTTDKIIITTDAKLKTQMVEDGHFQVILLKDFLRGYK